MLSCLLWRSRWLPKGWPSSQSSSALGSFTACWAIIDKKDMFGSRLSPWKPFRLGEALDCVLWKLWAEQCSGSRLQTIRSYTHKEVWKAHWAVCAVVTMRGSAVPIGRCVARTALRSCCKLGQGTRLLNPCPSQVLVTSLRERRWPWAGALDSWGKHFSERMWTWSSVCALWEYPITSQQNLAICCSYRQVQESWDFIQFIGSSE